MKKLAMIVLAVLFVSAMSASASWWWPFGKKAPAKEKAPAAEVQKSDVAKADQPADKAKCEKKGEAKKAPCCANMTEEQKASCKAKCEAKKTDKAEKKAACDAKKADKAGKKAAACEAKKADKAEKKAACDAKKAEKKAASDAKKAEKTAKKAEKKAEKKAVEVAPAEDAPAAK